ncbi:DNA methyltransferase [Mycobacterium phage Kanely]|nr:DNA methyltransferase [Mycobacterium phage ConceptII]QGJ88571.1 DNA methyltransferase [Mycobacterium phage Kanely]WAB09943.1 DNA methyltransferase [Mycobacterium phage Altman]
MIMVRPRLLDLFSGAGGASEGYARAGFEVVGVDIDPQPNYPYEFHQGDALKYLLEHHQEFDAFHASPPCQAFTNAQKIRGNDHPDYVTATRAAFDLIGKPWVIENVPGAPLILPIELCGCMFPGLKTYRPRLFELNWELGSRINQPEHRPHTARTTKMGRPPRPGEFMHVVGNFSGVAQAREAMGIDWMTRDELRESIPPAYTEFIGRHLMSYLVENQPANSFGYPLDS